MSETLRKGTTDRQLFQALIPGAVMLMAAGAFFGGIPGALLLPVAVVGTFCALGTTLGRLLLLCFGTMVMFGASPFSNTIRSLFPVLLVVGVSFAVVSIRRRIDGRSNSLKSFNIPLLVLSAVPIVSMYVMAFYTIDMASWIRDATTFILIPIGILYGIDAGLSVRAHTLQRFFTALGVMGALAYLTSWLVRRQQLPLSAELPLLSSSMIVIPVIAMSLSLYFLSSSRVRYFWAASAALQILMLVGAGGRSAVIYCAAMILFFSVASIKTRRGIPRLIALLAAGALIAVSFYRVYAPLVGTTFLANRFDWFANASFDAVEEDASGQARIRAYRIMWESFLEKPLLGNGFGYSYPPVSPTDMDVFTLDTPFVYLAKFGLIGTVTVVLAIAGIIRACVRQSWARECRMQVVAMWGATIVAWVATLPSGAPTEQKGFGVGLAVLVAISLAWCRESGLRGVRERRHGSELQPSTFRNGGNVRC